MPRAIMRHVQEDVSLPRAAARRLPPLLLCPLLVSLRPRLSRFLLLPFLLPLCFELGCSTHTQKKSTSTIESIRVDILLPSCSVHIRFTACCSCFRFECGECHQSCQSQDSTLWFRVIRQIQGIVFRVQPHVGETRRETAVSRSPS